MKRLRLLSIVFGLAAYAISAIWSGWLIHLKAPDVFRLGLAEIEVFIASFIYGALPSGIGVIFGILSWRRLEKPRPWLRIMELALIALPAIVGLSLIATIFIVSLVYT